MNAKAKKVEVESSEISETSEIEEISDDEPKPIKPKDDKKSEKVKEDKKSDKSKDEKKSDKPKVEKTVEKVEKPKTELKSILKNAKDVQPQPKPIVKKNKSISRLADKKQEVIDNMENETISKLPIVSEEWIKENILKDWEEFPGWKKAIKYLKKSLEGKDALKKKVKKWLRKAYELSSTSEKIERKELNKIIEEKLESSKHIKVYADLIKTL